MRRFQRAVVGGKPIGYPLRVWGRMRAIAGDTHSTQARRIRERLLPISMPNARDCTLEAMRTREAIFFNSRRCQWRHGRLLRL